MIGRRILKINIDIAEIFDVKVGTPHLKIHIIQLHRQQGHKNNFYVTGGSFDLSYCEAQGKGRAKGRPRKVTQRSFIDGGWWMEDILSLMLYIKFGCHPPPPPSTVLLLISRIKPSMDQVR